MSYQDQPWFALLTERASSLSRKLVAGALGVSAPVISQVLNGTGKYGSGAASTDKLAEKVVHTFGRFPCPHLTEQSAAAEPVVITAEQCRGFAHRPVPTGSPRDMQHWQACNGCTHKAHTAPPQPREVKPRKKATTSTPEAP
ncbi:hypothetical protein [Ramlibacter sp.]|uniref:hypothetical protein n=1 Tax=Ramlibacter sp. TaxID=1917967 RepID=UPI003D12E831